MTILGDTEKITEAMHCRASFLFANFEIEFRLLPYHIGIRTLEGRVETFENTEVRVGGRGGPK